MSETRRTVAVGRIRRGALQAGGAADAAPPAWAAPRRGTCHRWRRDCRRQRGPRRRHAHHRVAACLVDGSRAEMTETAVAGCPAL